MLQRVFLFSQGPQLDSVQQGINFVFGKKRKIGRKLVFGRKGVLVARISEAQRLLVQFSSVPVVLCIILFFARLLSQFNMRYKQYFFDMGYL